MSNFHAFLQNDCFLKIMIFGEKPLNSKTTCPNLMKLGRNLYFDLSFLDFSLRGLVIGKNHHFICFFLSKSGFLHFPGRNSKKALIASFVRFYSIII